MSMYSHSRLTPAALDEAYYLGTLTPERLRQAILSVDNDGYEGIPWSRGMRWIANNQACFLHVLRQAGTNAAEFFRDHFLLGDEAMGFYANQVLACTTVINSLLPWRRGVFVRDVLIFGRAIDHRWLKSVLEAGVSRSLLGEIIVEKLRCDDVHKGDSVVNFTVHEFLGRGSGHVVRYGDNRPFFNGPALTYWNVLSDDQFWQAMQICARKVPAKFFAGAEYNSGLTLADRLRARLCDEQVEELLAVAAANLTDWHGCTPSGLLQLPDDVLKMHMRRIGTVQPELIIQMVLRLASKEEGLDVLNEFRDALSVRVSAERLVDAYRQVAQLLISSSHHVLLPIIRQRLESAIRNHGWVVGVLSEGTHRGRTQVQLQHGGVTYVVFRQSLESSHRCYYPAPGDLVAIDLKDHWGSRWLVTKKVKAVSMKPIWAAQYS